jgi:hypothetical protein
MTRLTEEQFEALVEMIDARIALAAARAKNPSDCYFEEDRDLQAMTAARSVLVDDEDDDGEDPDRDFRDHDGENEGE